MKNGLVTNIKSMFKRVIQIYEIYYESTLLH